VRAPHELEGEQAVVPAGEHSGGDGRPRLERPRLGKGRVGLTGLAAGETLRRRPRAGRHEGRPHVEGGVWVATLHLVKASARRYLARVRPPRACRLARRRNHRSHEDEQPNIDPLAQHRCCEGSHRLRHHDHVGAIADRLHHRFRVLAQAGGVVVGRQVRVRTLWPRAHNRDATKCQYHESPPAPGRKTNVAVVGDLSSRPLCKRASRDCEFIAPATRAWPKTHRPRATLSSLCGQTAAWPRGAVRRPRCRAFDPRPARSRKRT
jgi:hypothetical protein